MGILKWVGDYLRRAGEIDREFVAEYRRLSEKGNFDVIDNVYNMTRPSRT